MHNYKMAGSTHQLAPPNAWEVYWVLAATLKIHMGPAWQGSGPPSFAGVRTLETHCVSRIFTGYEKTQL